ncbi:MAG TPA: CHY zinc finger protein [Saprospiraceae bacterium]|nr:CHY zinc finger protein [Saprospiraceae bacterium]
MTEIKGKIIDSSGRCTHWHSERDIIAIKFACCGEYYACYSCHEEEANHPTKRWPRAAFEKEKAILCGACQYEMTIKQYQTCDSRCPNCGADFNPRCSLHWPLYFEV